MNLVKKFFRTCSSFFFLLFSFFLFSSSVFARVENFSPVSFSDCGTEGNFCNDLKTGSDLGLISIDDDIDIYTSAIWPDSLFEFSGTAWNDDDNPYLMQFNFNPSISDHVVEAKFVFDGVFNPNTCGIFNSCKFKLLSSVASDFISGDEKIYEQADLNILNTLEPSIPSDQLDSLDSLSVRLLAYGTPINGVSSGIQSLIDQARLDVYIDDILPTVDGVTWKKNGSVIPQAGTATDPAYVSDLSSMTFDLELSDTGDAISGLDKEVFVIYQEHPSNPGTPYWTGSGGVAYCSWSGVTNAETLNGGPTQTLSNVELSRCSTQVLPAGKYVVANNLYDVAGNLKGGVLLTFVFDNISPTISNLQVDKSLVTAGNIITIEADVTDSSGIAAVSADFSYNPTYSNRPSPTSVGMTYVSGDTYQVQYTVPASWNDGNMYIKVAARDNTGGNWIRSVEQEVVEVDSTAPVVSITAPSAGLIKGQVIITGSVIDDHPPSLLASYSK